MSNTERIQANNAELREAIEMAENLPGAGGGVAEPVIEPLAITENGTYTANNGVDGFSPVSVNVPIPDGYIEPSGELEITENGTHDVTQYASVNVNVEGSGGGDNSEAEDLVNIIENDIENFENSRITKAGKYAFAYKTKLKTISLPNLATSNERLFSNCESLASLSIPNMRGSTNTYMAAYCGSLKTADVHQASSISTYSFYGCSYLTKLEFDRITSISTNAFNGCTRLATLIIRSSSMATLGGTSAFTGTKIAGGTGYIYVPAALIDSYKTATNWSTYAAQIRAIEDYPDICGGSV